MRKFFLLLLSILTLSPITAFAITYSPLAPLPGVVTGGDEPLVPYLISVLQLLIGVAGLIGVIRLVICGFELLMSPGESQRSHAKECIWKVVLGLLLAISAFILLRTINPVLITPTFAPPNVAQVEGGGRNLPTVPGWYYSYRAQRTGNEVFSSTFTDQPSCQTEQNTRESTSGVEIMTRCFQVQAQSQGNNYCVNGQPSGTFSQASEDSIRQQLCGNTSCVAGSPIGVNAGYCVDTCASGCTNIQGLGGAITAIRNLQQACGCTVTITGGTEYHLHQSHAAGRAIFDLRKIPQLDSIIRQGPSSPSFGGYTKYLVNGFYYTDEGNHWHACRSGENTSRGCN